MLDCLNLSLLEEDFECSKPMILFVGAGINMSPGCNLSWNALLDYMFQSTLGYLFSENELTISEVSELERGLIGKPDFKWFLGHREDFRLYEKGKALIPPLVKAAIVKQVHKDRYVSLISRFLYGQCGKQRIKEAFECYRIDSKKKKITPSPFYTLFQTAKMIMLWSPIKAVVSYNYDNFLTIALDILRTTPESYFNQRELKALAERYPYDVYGDKYEKKNFDKGFPIYHVHGYIPPPGKMLPPSGEMPPKGTNRIVLALDEYYESSRHVYAWQTTTPLHFLSHYTCVFLGCSMSDMAMQRMIYLTRQHGGQNNVYALLAAEKGRPGRRNSVASRQVDSMYLSFLMKYGVVPVYHEGGYYRLYQKIAGIVKRNIGR